MARTKVRNRPLDKSYAIVYLDALRVKAKEDGKSCMKSVFTALGVNFEGKKEVLGLWIAENEGAKFWMSVLTDVVSKILRTKVRYRLHGRAYRLPRRVTRNLS